MPDELPDFAAAETVLADFKDPETGRCAMDIDQAGSSYLQELYRKSLLTKDEERCLFEQLTKLKVHEAELSVLSVDLQCEESSRQLRELRAEIVEIRNHIVESNLRLVVCFAKKLRNAHDTEYDELVNEGNSILLKAVDLFDVSYGYRFSTCATTALRRSFMNLSRVNYRRKLRFVIGQTERFDKIEGNESSAELSVEPSHDIEHTSQRGISGSEAGRRLLVGAGTRDVPVGYSHGLVMRAGLLGGGDE